MTLFHDQPSSEGMANALKRAKQLSRIWWKPIAKMPMTVKCTSPEDYTKWPVGKWGVNKPQRGIPYSSTRLPEKFVGFNVSLETYMTALANPQSVLYTRDLTGMGTRMSSWYGSVCSAFASYAYDLPTRTVCSRWPKRKDMMFVGSESAQDVQLMDGLLSKGHVMLVTDVVRDETGRVVHLQITEETPPIMAVTEFSAEEFEKYVFPKYRLFRYLRFDRVTYTPSPYVPLEGEPECPPPAPNPTLLPDYGDKANYRRGETVELNVMETGWEELIVEREGAGCVYRTELAGEKGVRKVFPAKGGLYRVYCASGTERSREALFRVTDCPVKPEVTPQGLLVKLPQDQGRVYGIYAYRFPDMATSGCYEMEEEDLARGSYLITDLRPGDYEIRLILRNEFGEYNGVSKRITLPE